VDEDRRASDSDQESVGKSKANPGPTCCASATHRRAGGAWHREPRGLGGGLYRLRRGLHRPLAGARAEVRHGGPWPAFRIVRSPAREPV